MKLILSLSLILVASSASAELAKRCWGSTAPTQNQYLEKLKQRDACEDYRVPDMCEIKVVQAVSNELAANQALVGMEMSGDKPMSVIDLQLQVNGECMGSGTVIVKYGAEIGDCEVKKVEISRDYDCG